MLCKPNVQKTCAIAEANTHHQRQTLGAAAAEAMQTLQADKNATAEQARPEKR